MRSALALLVMVSGCNWAFGLKPTEINDGGDGTDAPPGIRTKLLWSTPGGTGLIAPDPPLVQVGPLTGAPLMTATYDDSGSFEIPFMLREAPHRIVFTMPGETIAHEYQWSISGATIVVPRATRTGAPPVPTGSGYSFTPANIISAPFEPVIATTGAFTYNRGSPIMTSGKTTSFVFSAAQPLAGPLGAPEASKSDKIILGDWAFHSNNLYAFNGYAIATADLMAGNLTTTTSTWITTARDMSTSGTDDAIPIVPTVDGSGRLPAGSQAQYMAYGISPGVNFPGFVDGKPMILPFMEATQFSSMFTLADPSTMLTGYDRVFVARITSTRTVAGAALVSSVAAITNQLSGNMAFAAPLAENIKLNTTALTSDTTFGASSQAASLKWDAEPGFTAHVYNVTLYEIANSRLNALRIYHVLAPAVSVDGTLLQAGHQYTFAITADNGYTNASQGDFKVVSFPFSESTTFSSAFTVQ